MSDTENKYMALFKNKVYQDNVQESKTTTTEESKLAESYNSVSSCLSDLKSVFNSSVQYEKNLYDTLIQLLAYEVYHSKINNQLIEYKNASEFMNDILNKDSELYILLNSIQDNLKIYSKEFYANNTTVSERYRSIINEQTSRLEKIISSLNINSLNDGNACVFDTKSSSLKSKVESNINIDLSGNIIHAYSGSVNTKGLIGQQSSIYIKQTNNETSSLVISDPLLGINNITYTNNNKNDSKVFFGLDLYDYTGSFYIENDGSDKNNKTQYTLENSRIRFGNILSGTTIAENENQSIRFKYSDSSNWQNGSIKYNGEITEKIFYLICKYSSEYGYINTHLADSVDIKKTIEYNNEDFILSGTLDYSKSLTDEYNSTNSSSASAFSGKITVKSVTNPSDISNNIKDVILYVDKEKKFVDVIYNPDSITNSTVSVSNTAEEFLSNFCSTFKIDNIVFTKDIPITNSKLKALLELYKLSKLVLTTDNLPEFTNHFYSYYNILTEIENSLITELKDSLTNIISTVEFLSTMSSTLSTADPIYCNNYTETINTNYTSISSTIQQNLADDSYEIANYYNGSLYNELSNDIDTCEASIVELMDDCISYLDKVNDDILLLSTTFCTSNSVSLKSTIQLISDILNMDQNITAMAVSNLNLKFYMPNINDWLNNFHSTNVIVDENDLLMIYYLYFIRNHINVDSFIKINTKLLNKFMLKIQFNSISSSDIRSGAYSSIKNFQESKLKIYNENECIIRPQLYEYFNLCNAFNNVNVEKYIDETIDITQYYAIIYNAFVNVPASKIESNIIEQLNIFKNVSDKNIKEIIYIYCFLNVVNEFYDEMNSVLKNDIQDEVSMLIDEYERLIRTYKNYKALLTSENIIISLFNYSSDVYKAIIYNGGSL